MTNIADWKIHGNDKSLPDQESRGSVTAILQVCCELDRLPPDFNSPLNPMPELVCGHDLLFVTSALQGIMPVYVYVDCVKGTCDCVHLIGGIPTQLKPCRAAHFLFGNHKLDNISQDDITYLWFGLVNGFPIVDSARYFCENYNSILDQKANAEMSSLLAQEIADHKVIHVESQPKCVHSLGAVWKSNGKLRPVTDCSRPEVAPIDNFMSPTFESFNYNSVHDAVDVLNPGDVMVVVYISSAYHSVAIHPDHWCYQGLTWVSVTDQNSSRSYVFALACASFG